jgi:hypothetical protein
LLCFSTTFPTNDDEYTPAQRRVIDTRLAASEEDLKKGRANGPFNTADEMIVHMKAALNRSGTTKKTKRRR